METVNDVLCLLNDLDFTDKIKKDQIEKLRCVKQRLVFEFQDYNVSKLIDGPNTIDEMNILIMANKLDARLEKTNSLRELILYFISFNYFVDTAKERVIGH